MNINKSQIKNILFDLGGVLLNIDYKLTEDSFISLGMQDFDEHYSQAAQSGLFDDFETGKISSTDFLNILARKFSSDITSAQMRDAWNAMLLDFPSNRLMLLDTLKDDFNLFMLSNTNEIHFEAFNEIFSRYYDGSITEYFEKVYYSHQIGMRKPDANVFQHILDDQQIKSEETLFIDDSEQHIKGALKLGIQAVWLEPGKDVIQLLKSIGILA